jgi:predicted dehydrogenase
LSRRLRVASLGAGFFGRFHLDAWRRIPEAELVALCERDRDRATRTAAEFDIPATFDEVGAMLDAVRPDILDVATPPPTHLPVIEAAAARGVAIICQKPFCGGLDGARSAVEIAKRAGVPLVVHENFRFQPWYAEIKRHLDAGLLGDVYQASFRLRPGDGQGPDAYLGRQPYFRTMPRLLIHETAIHLIDVFRFLFGEARSVYAGLARLNPVIAGEDAGIVLLDHANGVRSLFDGNRLADNSAKNPRLTMGEMAIEGSLGALRLDGDGGILHRARGAKVETALPYDWADLGPGGDSVRRFQNHVVRHMLDGTTPQNTGEAYLANLAIEEAIYLSHAQGRKVGL